MRCTECRRLLSALDKHLMPSLQHQHQSSHIPRMCVAVVMKFDTNTCPREGYLRSKRNILCKQRQLSGASFCCGMPRVHQAKQSLFSRWMHQHARQIISGRQKFVVGNLFLAEMTNLVSGMWQIMSAQNALLEIREFLWSERWSLTLRKSRRYFLLKNIPKYCTVHVPCPPRTEVQTSICALSEGC